MADVMMKSVVLYVRRQVSNETLDAIRNAEDGELIGVDVQEMSKFLPMTVCVESVSEAIYEQSPNFEQQKEMAAEKKVKEEAKAEEGRLQRTRSRATRRRKA